MQYLFNMKADVAPHLHILYEAYIYIDINDRLFYNLLLLQVLNEIEDQTTDKTTWASLAYYRSLSLFATHTLIQKMGPLSIYNTLTRLTKHTNGVYGMQMVSVWIPKRWLRKQNVLTLYISTAQYILYVANSKTYNQTEKRNSTKKKRRKIDSNKYFSHTNGIWLFVSISFNGSRVKFSFWFSLVLSNVFSFRFFFHFSLPFAVNLRANDELLQRKCLECSILFDLCYHESATALRMIAIPILISNSIRTYRHCRLVRAGKRKIRKFFVL